MLRVPWGWMPQVSGDLRAEQAMCSVGGGIGARIECPAWGHIWDCCLSVSPSVEGLGQDGFGGPTGETPSGPVGEGHLPARLKWA